MFCFVDIWECVTFSTWHRRISAQTHRHNACLSTRHNEMITMHSLSGLWPHLYCLTRRWPLTCWTLCDTVWKTAHCPPTNDDSRRSQQGLWEVTYYYYYYLIFFLSCYGWQKILVYLSMFSYSQKCLCTEASASFDSCSAAAYKFLLPLSRPDSILQQ